MLTRIASHAVQLTRRGSGAIYEYDEATEEFQLKGSHQIEKEFVEAFVRVPFVSVESATGESGVQPDAGGSHRHSR